jgi:hypothetical protein
LKGASLIFILDTLFTGGWYELMLSSLDPNILSPFQLLEPSMSDTSSLLVSAVSIFLACMISWRFFRSYRFSGFGYLLGLPVGFALLALSYGAQHMSLVMQANPTLHPSFYWGQIVLQSEGFALIAVSYQFKNFEPGHPPRQRWRQDGPRPRARLSGVSLSVLPAAMIALPLVIPISLFAATPYFNYSKIADVGFCMTIFNLAVIVYICRSALVSLVRAGNLKLLYIPAAYALFFLEQYSLTVTYFDNSLIALAGSMAARILALAVFVYATVSIGKYRRRQEIEAREKA